MPKNKAIWLLVLLTLLVFGLGIMIKQRAGQSPQKAQTNQTLVGSDKDAHGCIGSAGYSFNEQRQQCVRTWEVAAMVEAENAVQQQLAQKYGKPLDSIAVKVTKIDTDHVAGSVSFAPGSSAEGGAFLAFKQNGAWQLAYDGNGPVNCDELRQQYGFSDLVLSPQFCD